MDEQGNLERLTASDGAGADTLAALVRTVQAGAPRVLVYGCHGAFLGQVAARLAIDAIAAADRPLVVVTADEERASTIAQDVAFFLGPSARSDHPAAPPRVLHLQSVETSPYADLSPDRRAIM